MKKVSTGFELNKFAIDNVQGNRLHVVARSAMGYKRGQLRKSAYAHTFDIIAQLGFLTIYFDLLRIIELSPLIP